jgi:F0F1-type ATP synthase assembly protein I
MGRKKKYKSAVYQSLAVITQFGINMLVPIFLCSFVGLYIDKKFGTGFWFVLLFFVGALAGFRNIYILAKKIYEGDKDENKRDL